MRLVLSLFGDLMELCNHGSMLQGDEHYSSPSDLPLDTNSVQVSWQLCEINLLGQRVLVATERYSRYTLLNALDQHETLNGVLELFRKSYMAEVLWCLRQGGMVGAHQLGAVSHRFSAMEQRAQLQCLTTEQLDIQTYIKHKLYGLAERLPDRSLNDSQLMSLMRQVNCLPHRCQQASGEEALLFPVERFLSDSLYRFANGLCDLSLPGCKCNSFLNPHRRAVSFSMVSCNEA